MKVQLISPDCEINESLTQVNIIGKQSIELDDNTCELLIADQVLQKLSDRLFWMQEIYRVCKNGAQVNIFVPEAGTQKSFGDPTNVSFWNQDTFTYFSMKKNDSNIIFKVKKIEKQNQDLAVQLIVTK